MNFDQFTQSAINEDLRMFINNGGQAINFDSEMNTIVKDSFVGTKKFIFIGALSFLFYFFAVYTFVSALIPMMEKSTGGKMS